MHECLQDRRRTYTFYVDDAVLDVFGPRIGAYGLAVYMLLARHAKDKQAFPSYKRMRETLGLSRQTITRTIDTLIHAGLITKDKRTSHLGDADTNRYTLRDLTASHDAPRCPWPHGTSPQDGGTSLDDLPTSPQDGGTSSQGGGVGNVGTEVRPHIGGGTSPGRQEGISLKGSQRKEKDPPSPPSEGVPPSGEPARPRGPRVVKSSRCPPDYTPGEGVRAWAAEHHPAVDVDEALEAMRDYEFRTPHSDWDATLRTWIRRDARVPPRGLRRLTWQEQRVMADARSNQELEDLALGINTHNSVWAPVERHGQDFQPDTRPRRESGLLDGGG